MPRQILLILVKMDLDQPLGGQAYHSRYLHQDQRWQAYTRRLKLRFGIEANRAPGLNTWATEQRALKKTPNRKR